MRKMLRFPSIAGVITLTPQEWQSSCHRTSASSVETCKPVGANPSIPLLAPDRGRQMLEACRPLRGLANHPTPIPPVRTGGKQTVAPQRGSSQARELERTERCESGDSSRIRRLVLRVLR
jgi:hypothetical protein